MASMLCPYSGRFLFRFKALGNSRTSAGRPTLQAGGPRHSAFAEDEEVLVGEEVVAGLELEAGLG